jgi:hypothetical protein
MSKLDAVKIETSYLGELHLVIIASIILATLLVGYCYDTWPIWLLGFFLTIIFGLIVLSVIIYRKVMSLLRNKTLWEEVTDEVNGKNQM